MMEKRPFLKVELSTSDKMIELAGWFCLACLWIICLAAYDELPEIIPTHFNISMEVNDYGSKMTILFLPVIATLAFLGLTELNRHPHIFNFPVKITSENALYQYTNATRMLRCLKLIIAFVSGLAVLLIYQAASGKTEWMGSWLMMVVLGVIILPLIYFIIKALNRR
jgi:uncharacterized membrane protein